ncbi:hypothetical protein V5799_005201 [Amblyomma americanum]|uniref:Uncharacterized protein n=1 Tax=Amblyomma americanum TaxID=6943 RepID=A0AAQ4DZX9_AMBAM
MLEERTDSDFAPPTSLLASRRRGSASIENTPGISELQSDAMTPDVDGQPPAALSPTARAKRSLSRAYRNPLFASIRKKDAEEDVPIPPV